VSTATTGFVETRHLRHGKVTLALHRLGGPDGDRTLLAFHGLGERTVPGLPCWAASWPGPVWGLDLTGHGASTVPRGGGYSAEILMGDADIALAELGPCTVVGRGVGAYMALLISGARPTLVRGAVLADGPGLAGGPVGPASSPIVTVDPDDVGPPDPWALLELSRDVRPPDYAASFARQAILLSGLAWPLAVAARWRPPWLAAVAEEPGVLDLGLADAVAYYASA
jgi:pimeloyl-ACP methyl ester carboxylesterase